DYSNRNHNEKEDGVDEVVGDEESELAQKRRLIEDPELEEVLFGEDNSEKDFIKSLKKIRLMRQQGRCNKIRLYSPNGPATVLLVNPYDDHENDKDADDDLQEVDDETLPFYKRKKYGVLKKLIDRQRSEQAVILA